MNRDKLLELQYTAGAMMFQTVWDLYLKFYVAFMALNFTALGLMVQYIGDHNKRLIIVISFGVQNLLSAITALSISTYGKKVAEQQKALIDFVIPLKEQSALGLAADTTVPHKLGSWGARSNALSHILFMACWIAAMFVEPPAPKKAQLKEVALEVKINEHGKDGGAEPRPNGK